jgi:hypothetical protein
MDDEKKAPSSAVRPVDASPESDPSRRRTLFLKCVHLFSFFSCVVSCPVHFVRCAVPASGRSEKVLLRTNERCLWTGTRCRLEIKLWRTARQSAPTAKTTVRERPTLGESVLRMWRSRVEPALYHSILHTQCFEPTVRLTPIRLVHLRVSVATEIVAQQLRRIRI